MRPIEDEDIPDEVSQLQDVEDIARENQIGIWEYEGQVGNESD
jgi:hypothetical protein